MLCCWGDAFRIRSWALAELLLDPHAIVKSREATATLASIGRKLIGSPIAHQYNAPHDGKRDHCLCCGLPAVFLPVEHIEYHGWGNVVCNIQ